MAENYSRHGNNIVEELRKLISSQEATRLTEGQFAEAKDLCDQAEELCRKGNDEAAERILTLVRNIVHERETRSSYE